jgi:hypothetical protein
MITDIGPAGLPGPLFRQWRLSAWIDFYLIVIIINFEQAAVLTR